MVDNTNEPSLPAWMDVPQENVTNEPLGPTSMAPKKKPPFKKILFGLLIVFLLAGLGFTGYRIYQLKINTLKNPEILTAGQCNGSYTCCTQSTIATCSGGVNGSFTCDVSHCGELCNTYGNLCICTTVNVRAETNSCVGGGGSCGHQAPSCTSGASFPCSSCPAGDCFDNCVWTDPSPSPSPGGGGGGSSPSPSPSPGGGGGDGDCSGCGIEPTYSFNNPPTQIGPFPEAGSLVIYYVKLDVGGPLNVYLTTHEGSKVVNLDTNDKQRLVTNVSVNANETITLNKIEEADQGSPSCAPDSGNPWLAWGWTNVNSDNTCGSGLNGPPTQCLPMNKYDVSSNISWAQGFGKSIISQQCWADWREWPGDYDFNDYFLMFSYEPSPDRQDICDHTDITPPGGNLAPGGTVKIDLKAEDGSVVKANWLAVYNLDNLFGPGNPKGVCVPGTKTWSGDTCPDGYKALSFVHSPSSNLSDSFTLSYNDLHIKDYNTPEPGGTWTPGSFVNNLQFNGYFMDQFDQTSLSNPNCMEYVHFSGLSCTSLSRNPTTVLQIGDQVSFTCAAQTVGVTAIDHYEFRLSKDSGSTYTILPTASTGGDTTNPYQIATPGDYIVQCRVCSDDSADHCTNWGETGGWTPGPNDG